MVKVYEINGVTPVVHPPAHVHPSAVLIGDVIVAARCYVGPLVLEEGANVQDCCVMHGFPGDDTVVEVDGHIGHGAVLHGCRIRRNAMVGMNAVVMDQAVVGEESIVAAMSFVKAGMLIPPRSMAMGAPARVVRVLEEKEIAWKRFGTQQYHALAVRSLQTMREVDSLDKAEPGRKRITFDFDFDMHKPKE